MCTANCPSKNCKPVKREHTTKVNLFWWIAAIATLLVAWVYGYFSSAKNDRELLSGFYQEMQVEIISQNDRLYKLSDSDHELYVGLGTAWGYGGNLEVASVTDSLGRVEEVLLVDNSETFSYIKKMVDRKYFHQFKGRQIDEAFVINHDLDAVSGATVTSEAISRAVQEGGHSLAKNYFNLQPQKIYKKFTLSQSVIGLIVFFILAIFLFGRSKKLNLVLLAASIVGIGISWNNSFSISTLSKLFTGGFPSPREDLTIYVFLVFLTGGILFLRKNLYCHRICPFFGVQIFLKKLSGLNLKMHPVIMKYEGYVRRFLLWFALIIMFLNSNPTASNFEPFGMMFSLQGHGFQWYILPAVIVGSVFSPLFFCKHFCPAGESLTILTDLRKGKLLKSRKAKKKIKFKDLGIKRNNLVPSALYIISLLVIVSLMLRSFSS